jgi:hypothetical protein
MHFVREVKYIDGYKLRITFENGKQKRIDLANYLEGEIFDPLKDKAYFKKVSVNRDIDTIVWENGADFSPDFLYEIGTN